MERDRAFSGGNLVVVALFVFIIMNFGVVIWYVLDPSRDTVEIANESKFRNYWEIIFFISSSGLAVTAIFGFFVAWRQLKEAENARIATVYMGITSRWESDPLFLSRKLLKDLKDYYDDNNENNKTLQSFKSRADYVKDVLISSRDNHKTLYANYTRIIHFTEDVGLLCQRNYVDKRDLFDFFGQQMTHYLDLLMDYIIFCRGGDAKDEGGKDTYAYTLWLYDQAKRHSYFEYRTSQDR